MYFFFTPPHLQLLFLFTFFLNLFLPLPASSTVSLLFTSTLSVWLSLSPALARPFLTCRLPFLLTFKSGPSAAPRYLYVVFPFFSPPSRLSGPLLSPQSPTLHCLFVSLHSSPSVLIPSVSLTLISLIFLPLPLSFPFPSPPFFNHLNSFLILTIDPRVCHLARLSG